MLNFLQIQDFAIVETLDLEFAGGFTCITGETGAGKSILVGALGLLSGNRADSSAIRHGAERAELIAEFSLENNPSARDWLDRAELGQGDSCLLRRVIGANGRSRAWINGTAVTLQQLSQLGEQLIEIHGQNEHLRLKSAAERLRLLDEGGAYPRELEATRDRFEAWQALDRERRELLEAAPLDTGDLELLDYQIRELQDTMLPAEAFLAVESEHRLLSRSGEVLSALGDCLEQLDAEPSGASTALHRAAGRLAEHTELDKDISTAAGLLQEAAIACDEARASIQAAMSRLDISPDRLQDLERQLGQQHDLARKHRVEPDGLDQVLERLTERHRRSSTAESRLEALDAEIGQAIAAYRKEALGLAERRRERGAALAASVTALMQDLGMAGGRFEIVLDHDDSGQPAANGNDRLEFLVSANPGVPPAALQKVASGGELSRISLAIKVASKADAATAQVFDEVDAGIGGDTANSVGALLRSLSVGSQALCVTHLAQVAAFADQQLRVSKLADEKATRVETDVLVAEARIDEIARMLGGALSEQSRAHAEELLSAAHTRH